MSQEQAEAILNAANQEEKNVQDKVKAKLMEQVSRKKTDKDW
jgi:F0F1-type ATP synthase membrane subunit b/b'